MILIRRPVTLYDVDGLALAGLAVLLALAVWVVFWPIQRSWDDYRALAARRTQADHSLEAERQTLAVFRERLAELKRTVSTAAEGVPGTSEIPSLLRRLTTAAQDAALTVQTMTPAPLTYAGDYAIADVRIEGRGRGVDCLRFLERLSCENPYQSLRECQLKRAATAPDADCHFACTVRLYLLPETPVAAGGGGRP